MTTALETHWVCVAHRWLVPPQQCGARGTNDSSAKAHTERAPKHPTFTTTSRALADRLAAPVIKDIA